MGHSRIRLSQCMIVKNEEQNIERALQWGRNIVFEQIVIDTGSTDRTAEIAEQMGAKVFHYEWDNDFAAAKNYAIEQARGNWIAFLDADEYYEAEDATKLLNILEAFEAGRKKQGCPDIIRSSLVNLKKDGSPGNIVVQDRVFQNKRYLRYTGRIHEYLIHTDGKRPPTQYDAHKELTIFHTGYKEDLLSGKQARNEAMLLEELEQRPEDYLVRYYLGQCYMVQQNWDKAEEAFDICLQHLEDLGNATNRQDAVFSKMRVIIWKNDFSKDAQMQDVYKLAKEAFPKHPDADYLMGSWMIRQERYEDTITYLEQALHLLEAYGDEAAHIDMQGNLAVVYRNLAAAYREVGNANEFVRNAVLSLRLQPYTDVLLSALIASIKGDAQEPTVQASLDFLGKLYDMQNPKNLLFLIKCAKLARFERLADRIYSLPQMPSEFRP